MVKIAVIGERESVIGFRALGFSTFEAENADAARTHLRRLGDDKDVAIIFLVENFAEALEEDVARYRDRPLPAVICFPGRAGATGYGLASVRRAAERAIGADILFRE